MPGPSLRAARGPAAPPEPWPRPPLTSPEEVKKESVRSREGGNQLREGAIAQTPDSALPELHLRLASPNSGSRGNPTSSSPFPISLPDQPSRVSPTPTHPATRMMTRSGSPATVIKKSAKAGPKATKVHPKNTAAPIAGQLGAGWRPGQERQMGGARPPESPRGVATRPRKGRGAMSPPGPGEGEGGAPKPQIQVRATSSTEAEEGTNPCRSLLAASHLLPAPPPGQWKIGGGAAGAGCRACWEL